MDDERFFEELPHELEEAALVDGCGRLELLLKCPTLSDSRFSSDCSLLLYVLLE